MLNSGISPISLFCSAPTLYAARHLSFTDSTFCARLPEWNTSTSCVTPRLCLGESSRPDWGFSCSSYPCE